MNIVYCSQANISAPLQARPTQSENESSGTISSDMKTLTTQTAITPNTIKSLKKESTLSNALTDCEEPIDDGAMEVKEESANSSSPVDRKKIKIDSEDKKEETIEEKSIEQEQARQQNEPEPEIIVLGDRNAVLFSLETAQRASFDDIHDSFFELTVNDVRTLLRDLKAQAQNLDDAPLLTEKMREMQRCNQTLIDLGKYKKTVIRIQFPVDRLVLQGTFAPIDTIENVMNFIRQYLKNCDIDFHLCKLKEKKRRKQQIKIQIFTDTTPPKQILEIHQRLIEIRCVPSALLHFGLADSNVKEKMLKDEYLNRLSSPSGALLAASKSR